MTVTAQTGIAAMDNAMQSGFSAMQTTAQASFSAIRSSIEGEMNRTVAAVQQAVSTMKAAMNFSWKLPDLKVPQVNISGAFSLEPPTAPQFSVSWHKEGGVLTGAQIFGMQGNTLLGGGEAGKEAVLPLAVLWPNMAAVMTSVLERSAYPDPEAVLQAAAAPAATNIQNNFMDGRSWDQSTVNNLPTEAVNAFSEMRTQQTNVSSAVSSPEVMETAVTENLTRIMEGFGNTVVNGGGTQGGDVTNASYAMDTAQIIQAAVTQASHRYEDFSQTSAASSFPMEIAQSAMTTALSNFVDSRIDDRENGISASWPP